MSGRESEWRREKKYDLGERRKKERRRRKRGGLLVQVVGGGERGEDVEVEARKHVNIEREKRKRDT